MQSQYNITKHTILPLIYRIMGPASHVTYLLKEPTTQSLFMFNPLTKIKSKTQDEQLQNRYFSWLADHVRKVEELSGSKLTHVIANHGLLKDECSKFIDSLIEVERTRNIKFMYPELSKSNNLKPEVIGEISVCFIGAEGYMKDYNLLGVTHISPTSTKVPILFVENLLGVCRVDHSYDEEFTGQGRSDSSYIKSLNTFKYFPNETYVFPSTSAHIEDLLFSKAMMQSESSLERATSLIDQKIKIFQENQNKFDDYLIPTTVMEEKFMNPFLNSEKFCNLLGVSGNNKVKSFSILRKLRAEWKSKDENEK